MGKNRSSVPGERSRLKATKRRRSSATPGSNSSKLRKADGGNFGSCACGCCDEEQASKSKVGRFCSGFDFVNRWWRARLVLRRLCAKGRGKQSRSDSCRNAT